jgi:hypothetical protein
MARARRPSGRGPDARPSTRARCAAVDKAIVVSRCVLWRRLAGHAGDDEVTAGAFAQIPRQSLHRLLAASIRACPIALDRGACDRWSLGLKESNTDRSTTGVSLLDPRMERLCDQDCNRQESAADPSIWGRPMCANAPAELGAADSPSTTDCHAIPTAPAGDGAYGASLVRGMQSSWAAQAAKV